jgi:hypothetical protein
VHVHIPLIPIHPRKNAEGAKKRNGPANTRRRRSRPGTALVLVLLAGNATAAVAGTIPKLKTNVGIEERTAPGAGVLASNPLLEALLTLLEVPHLHPKDTSLHPELFLPRRLLKAKGEIKRLILTRKLDLSQRCKPIQ